MQNDKSDPRTMIRLRFLAEAVMDALSASTGEAHASEGPLAGEVSEDVLRTILQRAVPVLRASIHQQLAEQIETALAGGA